MEVTKRLTSAEVTEKRLWIQSYPDSASKIQALTLCDSHEVLERENERLKSDAENYEAMKLGVEQRISDLTTQLADREYRLAQAEVQLAAMTTELDEAKRQVVTQQANNRQRNLELDALHYVWCSGGCPGGIHRFSEHSPLTQEIVELAVRNTSRLISSYVNRNHRANGSKTSELNRRYAYFDHVNSLQQAEDRISNLEAQLAERDRALHPIVILLSPPAELDLTRTRREMQHHEDLPTSTS